MYLAVMSGDTFPSNMTPASMVVRATVSFASKVQNMLLEFFSSMEVVAWNSVATGLSSGGFLGTKSMPTWKFPGIFSDGFLLQSPRYRRILFFGISVWPGVNAPFCGKKLTSQDEPSIASH